MEPSHKPSARQHLHLKGQIIDPATGEPWEPGGGSITDHEEAADPHPVYQDELEVGLLISAHETAAHGEEANFAIQTIDPYLDGVASTAFTAGQVILAKLPIPTADVQIGSFTLRVDTQAGNLDVGIFDASGARLTRSGVFACPAAGVVQRTLSPAVTLQKGKAYWAALYTSSSAVRLVGHSRSSGTLLQFSWKLRSALGGHSEVPATWGTPSWDESSTTPIPALVFNP